MGYRIAVLDPDIDCPSASVADELVVGAYDDVGAALRLADRCDVVTYELEHIAAAVVEASSRWSRSGPGARRWSVTHDRIAERRFVEGAGVAVAPWREVRTTDELRAAARPTPSACRIRLKAASGGYDGRGQIRVATAGEVDGALAALGRPPGSVLLAEREIDFEAELSVIVARGVDGATATFPIARNVHDAGILFESVAPGAGRRRRSPPRAADIGLRLAAAMDLVGTLTAELFLLRDGSLVVNELAPRVHNSGHWTIEGAATSQFEQHIRAICGLGLGSTDGAVADRDGQPARRRTEAPRAAHGRGGRARGSRRPPASLRQAAGLRTPQDGARHGARPDGRQALTRARTARDALGWAADPTTKEDR